MPDFDPLDLEEWCGGQWHDRPHSVDGFCIDTRILEAGDLFIALKTDKRDGHDFLAQAKEKGASAALVEVRDFNCNLPQLVVDDSLIAFQEMATGYRQTWDALVIGVTGSCGKTTTKEMLALVFGGPENVHSTSGNLNNHLGVPLTILSFELGKETAIIEAGISEKGEMDILEKMIQPDVVVYTSIGKAHLKGLGTVEDVAREKFVLSRNVAHENAIYVTDSCVEHDLFETLGVRATYVTDGGVDFGMGEDMRHVTFYAEYENGYTRIEIPYSEEGTLVFNANVIGFGFASNAALSIAVGLDFGIEISMIAERILNWKAGPLRGEIREFTDKRIYLDCYNANPPSLIDALDSFMEFSDDTQPRMFIIGCMEELGPESDSLHELVGEQIELEEKDVAYLIGNNSEAFRRGIGETDGTVHCIQDLETIRKAFIDFEGEVFVKGSRMYRLERVMDFISGNSKGVVEC